MGEGKEEGGALKREERARRCGVRGKGAGDRGTLVATALNASLPHRRRHRRRHCHRHRHRIIITVVVVVVNIIVMELEWVPGGRSIFTKGGLIFRLI